MRSYPSVQLASRARVWSGRCAVAPLLLLVLLMAASCSVGQSTGTPTPHPQASGAVYVMALDPHSGIATAYALHLADGRTAWQAQVSAVGNGGGVFAGSTVYLSFVIPQPSSQVGTTLEARNATTGALLWQKVQTSGEVVPLAATNGSVFVQVITYSGGSLTTIIEALRASDGAPLWSHAMNGNLSSLTASAVVGAGALYFDTTATTPATGAYTLHALDTSTGAERWQLSLQNALAGAPVFDGNALYLAEQYSHTGVQSSTPTSHILAVNASDGKTLWQTTPPVPGAAGSVAVNGGIVCYTFAQVNHSGGGVVALRSGDGSLVWQAFLHGGAFPLTMQSGVAYVIDSDVIQAPSNSTTQALDAYDAATGKLLFARDFPDLHYPILSILGNANGALPQVAQGALYVIAQSATQGATPQPLSIVLALSASDGSQKWARALTGEPLSGFIAAH